MRIQYLNGGLANQAFQYIFARFAELYYPEGGKVWLDDSFFFFNHVHNGYELEKVFGIKANLLSDYFTPDVWEAIVEERKKEAYLGNVLAKFGIDCKMVFESSDIEENIITDGKKTLVKMASFCPEIVQTKDDTCYHGYWINKDWFSTYREEFIKEFRFPPIEDYRNKEYEKEVQNSMSVAMHVRRGDYVTLNCALDTSYYEEDIQMILDKFPQSTFFVFSDDIEWCKQHVKELGLNKPQKVVYVEGNNHGKNYIDLQLMTMCKGVLLSNSAFSYLGGLLNTNKQFWVNFNERIL